MKFTATVPEVASMRNNPYSFAVGRSSALSLVILLLAATALARGATEIVLHDFVGRSGGLNPSSALILDTAGNLYGTTAAGGWGPCGGGCGKVFKLTPNGSGYTESLVYAFQGSATGDGQNPWGALTADAAGDLYGVTQKGGQNSGQNSGTDGTFPNFCSSRNGERPVCPGFPESAFSGRHDFPNSLET